MTLWKHMKLHFIVILDEWGHLKFGMMLNIYIHMNYVWNFILLLCKQGGSAVRWGYVSRLLNGINLY